MATGTALPRRGASDTGPPAHCPPLGPRHYRPASYRARGWSCHGRRPGPFAEGSPLWCLLAWLVVFALPALLVLLLLAAVGGGR